MGRPKRDDTDRGDLKHAFLQNMKAAKENVNPRLVELTEALFKEFGGAAGVAGFMRKEFEAAEPGSTSRSRILMALTDMVQANQKLGLIDEIDPSELSDDQLEEIVGSY